MVAIGVNTEAWQDRQGSPVHRARQDATSDRDGPPGQAPCWHRDCPVRSYHRGLCPYTGQHTAELGAGDTGGHSHGHGRASRGVSGHLTVFLAMGAWRISRSRVLTRRMPAIETLGSATVLCTDKTGTLTFNRMTVRQLYADGQTFVASQGAAMPEMFHPLLEYGVLASKKEIFDPMERALHQMGDEYLSKTEHWHAQWAMVRDYPLSPQIAGRVSCMAGG